MGFFRNIFNQSNQNQPEDRNLYFKRIALINSPLQLLTDHLDSIVKIRTNYLSEPTDLYLLFANKLSQLDTVAAKTRASFIRMQCNGIKAEDLFEQHQESWGIPKFKENLISVDDFRYGFLWKFRDHSTSWGEDVEARDWFFNSLEANFVRHYEFWACDKGPDEILQKTSGDYKSIMWTIVNEYQDYSALTSPVFKKQDLIDFYHSFNEDGGDYYRDDLLEIIEENPNW